MPQGVKVRVLSRAPFVKLFEPRLKSLGSIKPKISKKRPQIAYVDYLFVWHCKEFFFYQ